MSVPLFVIRSCREGFATLKRVEVLEGGSGREGCWRLCNAEETLGEGAGGRRIMALSRHIYTH